jgi:uncharacterized membrane protein YphA (DoxX/SURF4 family)
VTIAEALARPLLAGAFVYGGIETLRDPTAASVPTPILDPVTRLTGLPAHRLLAINAGAQVVAGVALAVGILPRPAAAVLALSLVPTFGGARSSGTGDETAPRVHVGDLLRNVATLGGLVIAATSTGGRPSLPWRARRAARHVVDSAGSTLEHLRPAT